MELKEWRDRQTPRMTHERLGMLIARVLGRRVDTAEPTISRYENGVTQAPTEIVECIYRISGGMVTADDFHRVRLRKLREKGRLASLYDDDERSERASAKDAPHKNMMRRRRKVLGNGQKVGELDLRLNDAAE